MSALHLPEPELLDLTSQPHTQEHEGPRRETRLAAAKRAPEALSAAPREHEQELRDLRSAVETLDEENLRLKDLLLWIREKEAADTKLQVDELEKAHALARDLRTRLHKAEDDARHKAKSASSLVQQYRDFSRELVDLTQAKHEFSIAQMKSAITAQALEESRAAHEESRAALEESRMALEESRTALRNAIEELHRRFGKASGAPSPIEHRAREVPSGTRVPVSTTALMHSDPTAFSAAWGIEARAIVKEVSSVILGVSVDAFRTLNSGSMPRTVSASKRLVAGIGRILSQPSTVAQVARAEWTRQQLLKAGIFDASWYAAQRPDVAAAIPDLLGHFVFHGIHEATSPHPLIDVKWLSAMTGREPIAAMEHYIRHGRKTELDPHPLFNVAHYRREAGLNDSSDALSHYLLQGAGAGLSPCPLFDPAFYAAQISTLQHGGVDPLLHYACSRWSFLADPHPLFDSEYYRGAIAGVLPEESLLAHYLREGWRDNLSPHRLFSVEHYLSQHPELPTLGVPPLLHYLEYGARERTSPHPGFSGAAYLDQYADVAEAGLNPLLHYVRHGMAEGRHAEPVS